ncbi:MAG: CrcB family protein [Chloroflexi bacterium]|nr:CrcB family protein [Chloroflexota bacterium]MDA1146988.1 CrcB family protein [Chloroflexota bacterium]
MQVVLAVAAGGALGAVSRYALSSGVTNALNLHGGGTFVANVLGAFLLGAVIGLTEERWVLSETARTGITVGVLGGFTTFSTYMYDVVHHAEGDRWVTSALMLALTIVFGLVAMVGGLAAGRAG